VIIMSLTIWFPARWGSTPFTWIDWANKGEPALFQTWETWKKDFLLFQIAGGKLKNPACYGQVKPKI
jgi:hypothetical protein